MPPFPTSHKRGFVQYVVLGVIILVAASVLGGYQYRKHASQQSEYTASLVGSGGVTITTPNNNATVISPVHVSAYVASGFTGPVRTMQVLRDNTLVYQGAGTTVETDVPLASGATHNLTVLALKKNGSLEGSATVYVTVVTATPTPLPLPPSASSVPPLPAVPSP